MKRFLGLLSLAAALALVVFTIASAEEGKAAPEKKAAEAAAKSVTVSGEIVDMACYMGHGAMGEKHKECAVTCVAAGSPMGLLTDKGVLYVLLPPHDNKDGYNKAKELAGDKVEITGMPSSRNGTKAIEVASAKPMAAPAATSSK